MAPRTHLLDARSSAADWQQARTEIERARILGIDCETQDAQRHAGLNSYNTAVRQVFDHRRTVMTGFSVYVDGSDTAWYVNLAHADTENCVPFSQARQLIDAIPPDCVSVAHNAPFELVMFEQCHGVHLQNVVCTLQLAVTHHGPDEYDIQKFLAAPLTGFYKLSKAAAQAFSNYTGSTLTGEQQDLLNKFIAKESEASHSYNGFVDSISRGYSLKHLTESQFGIKQMTYKEVLNGKTHMGELAGEQVCAYGADDAYWAVQHYNWLSADLMKTNPQALVTFLQTENPMVQVFAECWRDGLQLDLVQVYRRQAEERLSVAQELRKLKGLIRSSLPFPEDPNSKLMEKQDWYAKGWQKKRAQIEAWANSPDAKDDFTQCFQVSNPIGNAWAIEQGLKVPKSGKLNLLHYHGMRTILFDLLGHRIIYSNGDVSSDKEARGKAYETFESLGDEAKKSVMVSLQALADMEQRMKLFITPYTQLMDPETGRVYPTLSSQLATRRLAGRNPNGMQLAKDGDSAYIRSFFLADSEECAVVSADWSAIELVLIGEFSGDPAFREVYGQLPYGDLHTGAAADCLAVKTLPGLTEEEFREFKFGRNPNNRELKHIFTGQPQAPAAFYKFCRGTPVGKGANFSYWYSGALSTVGSNLGWTSEEMWAAVDLYRNRFGVAEQWRVNVGQQGVEQGFITLPDGHRRRRLEATPLWNKAMMQKFADISPSPGMLAYGELACRRLTSRAKNQLVNAMIQGSCATLAKRSILRLRELVKNAGLQKEVRFMIPIHDELLYSCHKSVLSIFIPLLRQAMCEHPTLVKTLPLNCSVAIGRTFRPYDGSNPAFSQIELDEVIAPIPGVIGPEWEGRKLPDDKVAEVIEYMFAQAA